MSKFFVPYDGDNPATVDIKGHRLLLLSSSDLNDAELDTLGGDQVREVELLEDETDALAELASSVNGGVVVTPPGVSIETMLAALEKDLPWVH